MDSRELDNLDFWKAAEFLRTQGAEHMGESRLNVSRTGRFRKSGCRWSIMHDIIVGVDDHVVARVLIDQETAPRRDGSADDPLADDRQVAKEIVRELWYRGYVGDFQDDRRPPPDLEELEGEIYHVEREIYLKLCRLKGRFDKEIRTVKGLSEEYRRLVTPNLAAAFGLILPDTLDTMSTIQRVVAAAYSVSVEDLRGSKKRDALELPRQVAMHLGIELGMKNAIEVAEYFGAAKQAEVVQARKRVRLLASTDRELTRKLQELQREVEKSLSPA